MNILAQLEDCAGGEATYSPSQGNDRKAVSINIEANDEASILGCHVPGKQWENTYLPVTPVLSRSFRGSTEGG